MKGKCLCGEVQFEITGMVPSLYQCHCSECRKVTGASATIATIVDACNFHWISGRKKISSFTKGSGYRTDFCSICGSPVPNVFMDSGKVWIPAGLLEDADGLAIAINIYTNSKAAWETTAQSAEEYGESPTLEALINAL